MLQKFAPRKKREVPLQLSPLENLHHQYIYGVVIPYSSNLRDPKSFSTGIERLSFYSAFALNASIEMYNNNVFQKFILLSDATFGEERKSTGLLMKEALLRAPTVRRIREEDIILLGANHLNNTAAQIKELTTYLFQNELPFEQFLVLCWQFHKNRICKHMKGFDIKLDIVSVEEAHEYYNSNFHAQELYRILPEVFEKREKTLRRLADFDKRGFIPRLFKRFTGPVVTDIQKLQSSYKISLAGKKVHLGFDNLSGKKKLKQLKK